MIQFDYGAADVEYSSPGLKIWELVGLGFGEFFHRFLGTGSK